MNRKEMLADGWVERKEFWIKKGKYFGTWIWRKQFGSSSKTKKRPSKKEGGMPV